MGQTPYETQDQQYIEGGRVDMGGHQTVAEHDLANFEGKVI